MDGRYLVRFIELTEQIQPAGALHFTAWRVADIDTRPFKNGLFFRNKNLSIRFP